MNWFRNRIRNGRYIRTAVRRQHAEGYLLLTLFSFATSVSLTRLFLELTGYPQLGNSELHIAHVLWGGLFLFIASILPLLIANRWVFSVTAVLAGIGVGLFIDEVGKFITQTNDYFYPSAAPIIYSFFLLTVLLYIVIRRQKSITDRSDLYCILQDMEEVVDRDLSEREYLAVEKRLRRVIDTTNEPDTRQLAAILLNYLEEGHVALVHEQPGLLSRVKTWYLHFESTWLTRNRFRAVLSGGLLAVSAWNVMYPITVLGKIRSTTALQSLLTDLVTDRLVRNPTGITWFGARVGLEGSIGLLLLVSALLLMSRLDRRAISIAYIALLFSLVLVNILVFYFDQFSTINQAVVQFVLFMAVLRYRVRYLDDANSV